MSRNNMFVDTTPQTPTQQTQNICITFVQCRSNVEDVQPTLHKCYIYITFVQRFFTKFTKKNEIYYIKHNIFINVLCLM